MLVSFRIRRVEGSNIPFPMPDPNFTDSGSDGFEIFWEQDIILLFLLIIYFFEVLLSKS